MISYWMRVFVLTAVGALVANAQCYVNCAVTACTEAPCNTCPHHHSSQGNRASCQHQHSEFTGPQLRVAVGSVATAVAVLAPCTAAALILREPALPLPRTNSSPPGSDLSASISVLRI